MITSTRENATNVSGNMANKGTATLKKYARMTPQEASHSGKIGKADIHMHSTYSDGIATIEEVLARVQQDTNLDVIAITDHDVIEGALRARDLHNRHAYRFDLIVGEEVTTTEGHLLGLFLEKRVPAGLCMERSIDLIHEQGGLAIIAHPLHKFFRHSCQRAVMDRIHASQDVWFDGIETWNASFCGIYANYIAMSANRVRYGLPEVGNSDAHMPTAIGSGFSWFPGKDAQEFRAALEQGLTAPGGKMWEVQAYYHWVRYLMSKEGRMARRISAAAA
ncbi:MAG TPA: PHP-associated domain-containing protein [Ktedonobacteraceae bacterium]|nr:PHP-associated domain-containing protein [Ktedonobacteraceae bacterium]